MKVIINGKIRYRRTLGKRISTDNTPVYVYKIILLKSLKERTLDELNQKYNDTNNHNNGKGYNVHKRQ